MFNIEDCNQEMDLSIEAFKNDLKNIRTGRVSPDILKTVIIDSYGSKIPLTQLSLLPYPHHCEGSGIILNPALVMSCGISTPPRLSLTQEYPPLALHDGIRLHTQAMDHVRCCK